MEVKMNDKSFHYFGFKSYVSADTYGKKIVEIPVVIL